MATGAGPLHIGSHRSLVDDVSKDGVSKDVPPRSRLEAVMVPSVRSPHHLRNAAQLAARFRAHLLVISSGPHHPAEEFEYLTRITGRGGVTVLRLPDPFDHGLLRFDTSLTGAARAWRGVDTSAKRNLALLLARTMGWRNLAFLDDDVQVTTAAFGRMVNAVTSQHSPWRVAGCAFPERGGANSHTLTGDNSVVCHANRLTGGAQDTFIGGGAMAIRSAGGYWPFFPNIYNEDWLFLFGLMLWQKQARVALSGELRQLPQDPFREPRIAADQEFGDVLAEGLARLLHLKQSRTGMTSSDGYWRNVMALRADFIDAIAARVESHGHERADEILKSLLTAQRTLEEIAPEHLAEYVKVWRGDLSVWYRRQRSLVPASTMGDALASLDLTDLVVPVGTGTGLRTRMRLRLPARPQLVARPAGELPAFSGV